MEQGEQRPREENPVVGYAGKRLQTGKPRRLRIKPLWPVVTPLVVAGGAFVVLVGSTTTSTRGGTRSCKLAWEQRQREIDAVADGGGGSKDGAVAPERAGEGGRE